MTSTTPPVLLVSRCLLGVACRYDGDSRPCPVLGCLPAHWVLLDLCPEEDVGMGVPRPPIALVEEKGLKLVEVQSGRDWTRPMDDWCRSFARILVRDGAAGAILKARSPSCGAGDAEVFPGAKALKDPAHSGRAAHTTGDGFWVRALKSCQPDFPMISDEDLADPARREHFLQAVIRRHSLYSRLTQ